MTTQKNERIASNWLDLVGLMQRTQQLNQKIAETRGALREAALAAGIALADLDERVRANIDGLGDAVRAEAERRQGNAAAVKGAASRAGKRRRKAASADEIKL